MTAVEEAEARGLNGSCNLVTVRADQFAAAKCCLMYVPCSFFRSLASKDVWLCKQNMLLLKDTQGNIEYNYQNCLLFKVLQSYWRKLLLH